MFFLYHKENILHMGIKFELYSCFINHVLFTCTDHGFLNYSTVVLIYLEIALSETNLFEPFTSKCIFYVIKHLKKVGLYCCKGKVLDDCNILKLFSTASFSPNH